VSAGCTEDIYGGPDTARSSKTPAVCYDDAQVCGSHLKTSAFKYAPSNDIVENRNGCMNLSRSVPIHILCLGH
jgi:hypothetical protein